MGATTSAELTVLSDQRGCGICIALSELSLKCSFSHASVFLLCTNRKCSRCYRIPLGIWCIFYLAVSLSASLTMDFPCSSS
jgi:hypothetical protein